LLLQADEHPQSFIDYGLLCWQGRQFLSLTYQFLIQDDVGSQWITSMCMISPLDVYYQSGNSIPTPTSLAIFAARVSEV